MEDEEFEKMFNKLADKFEDYLYFLSMGMCHYKDTKHGIKQILEEIEGKAYDKATKDFNGLASEKLKVEPIEGTVGSYSWKLL